MSEEQRESEERSEPANRRVVWLGAGIALVIVVVLAVISVVSGQRTETPDNPRAEAAHRVSGDPLALGSPDAPVTVVEWADFQCPFCALFAHDTAPMLIDQYVRTGKVRLEWRDFAFLGPESRAAAAAARAAGRQGKFWEYHDVLYAQQKSENSGALTSAYLTGIAGQLGLDQRRFAADMADPAIAKQVAADQAEGGRLGVTGTPTVIINGDLMSGAQPLADYRQAIDAAYAKATAPK
ncbi:DsbA family protein [Pseudonocardia spinosispora]|uniref:DsbA family protein n=1 Tax=Pseudonocardia spinosispora TaxID=103441 RepID=UPI00048FFD90|nr:thioredoxin domain-containing protein [Pseudonocardia spinosispora]